MHKLLDENIHNILSANQFGVSIANIDGKLVYGNQALLDLFQTTEEEFIGRTASEFYVRKEQREIIVAQLKRDGFIKAINIELIRDNGTTFWATLSFKRSLYAGKNAYFCWFFDLTERMEMETRLKEQTKLALHSGKLASLGEMAAGIGHEINNPLTIVTGMLSLINSASKKEDFDREKIRDYVKKGQLALNRISNIVTGLTNLSRIDHEERRNFNLVDVIEETVSLLSEIYKTEQIEILKELPKTKEVLVKGNRGRFQQVVMNLLVNARDALENSKANKQVRIKLNIEESKVKLFVEDNGQGIKKSDLTRIFQPFFTTKDVNKGTGIGLALSFNIVKEHFGSIEAESEEGKGTLFKVEVPLAPKEDEIVINPSVELSKKISKNFEGNILVVDDEEFILEYVETMLNKMDVQVKVCSTVTKAKELLGQEHFDLIISDIKMPGEGGYELLKYVRSNSTIAQPKFILMTGGAFINELNEFNYDDLVYKPFVEEDFIAIIKKSLN